MDIRHIMGHSPADKELQAIVKFMPFATVALQKFSPGELTTPVEVRVSHARIIIRQCSRLVEDTEKPTVRRVYTGGLMVSVDVDDPNQVLRTEERHRIVRVRRGWGLEGLSETLANLDRYATGYARVRDQRQARTGSA